MRLGLYFYENNNSNNSSDYHITVADDTGQPINATEEQFVELISKALGIERMARKVLGSHYKALLVDKVSKVLVLQVNVGTSNDVRRFDFRSLCGWIELHDFV